MYSLERIATAKSLPRTVRLWVFVAGMIDSVSIEDLFILQYVCIYRSVFYYYIMFAYTVHLCIVVLVICIYEDDGHTINYTKNE